MTLASGYAEQPFFSLILIFSTSYPACTQNKTPAAIL
jgi:hypothetical protein